MMTMPNYDLTVKGCKEGFAKGEVSWIQENPNDMGIFFLTNKGDKGYIVTRSGGPLKRYKSNFDRGLDIAYIKGL